MQVSKLNVAKPIEKKIFRSLYQVLADIKQPEAIEKLINAVLSDTEKTVLAKRLAIAVYLKKNKSYDSIKDELRVSSASIAAVQSLLEKGSEGLSLAIKTIEADEWAENLAGKISAKITSWRKSFT